MSGYKLLIYSEELTEEEIAQASLLCYEAIIERIEDNDSNLITYAYWNDYSSAEIGVCYRIYESRSIEALGLLKKKPVYIGKLNDDVEMQCVNLSGLLFNLKNTFSCIAGIGRSAQDDNEQMECVFGLKNAIGWEKAQSVESDYLDALRLAETSLNKLLSDCKVTEII